MAVSDLETAFALLDDEASSDDLDLAPSLQQAYEDPDDAAQQDQPVPLGRTPAIDFVQRRMIPNTAGGPLMLYGIDALKQWIEKCLRTRRGDAIAGHPDFGLDMLIWDIVDGGPIDDGAADQYIDAVGRALPVHPAIADVVSVDLDYSAGDDLATTLIVIALKDSGEDPLQMTLEQTLNR